MGNTVKYSPLPLGVPLGKGLFGPYIPRLVLIQIEYMKHTVVSKLVGTVVACRVGIAEQTYQIRM